MRWFTLPARIVVGPPRVSDSASVRTDTYVFQCAVSGQLSDRPVQSSLPMYAMAMRPVSPAVTAGKTALVTCDGVTRTFGVQYVAGRPAGIAWGLLRGS